MLRQGTLTWGIESDRWNCPGICTRGIFSITDPFNHCSTGDNSVSLVLALALARGAASQHVRSDQFGEEKRLRPIGGTTGTSIEQDGDDKSRDRARLRPAQTTDEGQVSTGKDRRFACVPEVMTMDMCEWRGGDEGEEGTTRSVRCTDAVGR